MRTFEIKEGHSGYRIVCGKVSSNATIHHFTSEEDLLVWLREELCPDEAWRQQWLADRPEVPTTGWDAKSLVLKHAEFAGWDTETVLDVLFVFFDTWWSRSTGSTLMKFMAEEQSRRETQNCREKEVPDG